MKPRAKVKKLLRATSKRWNVILFLVLIAIASLACTIRFYVFEPVVVSDTSMTPAIHKGKRVWVCKLPYVKKHLQAGDFVLAKLKNGDLVLRKILAMPGDTVVLFPNGKASVGDRSFKWYRESEILDKREFYVPKKGDSISFDSLNDISFDYASGYLHKKYGFRKYFVKAALYQGNDSVPLSRVGSTRLAGRPISAKEVPGLPWQELYLIKLQIKREEPGAKNIHFERKLFRRKDSTEVKTFVMDEDCYYLICIKGDRCEDSREFGYVPQNSITGKVIPIQFPFSFFKHFRI